MAEKFDAVILGGGISGLTAGLLLKQQGLKTVVLEATGRAGGSILTWQQDGFLFELGPNTVLNNTLEIDALCDAAGLLESRLRAEPASTKRYIVKEGSLIPLPSGPLGFLATPLFSWGAKMRLLKEPFIGRAPKEVEETIAAFTRRRLGQEFLDYAVGPFVSGVYAGDPSRLSVRHATAKIYALEEKYGGLIKGALAKRKGPAPAGGLFSFPKGLETLPLVISGTLGANWRPGRNITTVRKSEVGFVVEALKSGTELETYESRAVVTALPAASVSEILAPLGGFFPDGIASLPYADVAVVCMGFRREDVEHPLDGFGFLAPEVEGRHVLGCLFPSSLFPGRAPRGQVALTAFVGGAVHPERAQADSGTILDRVLKDLRHLLGLRATPTLTRVEIWRPAIPQYEVGHGAYKSAGESLERDNPGLFVAGNLLNGVSVGDCIKSATKVAQRVATFLRPG
jgi:oxygen-dependent protoporphyrinogen oxidase